MNTYNSENKYFDIDTDINVNGLTILKGSAPAADDSIFIFNNAKVTVEVDVDFLTTYRGDNFAADAEIKTGHLQIEADAIMTLHTDIEEAGLESEPTSFTSTLTLNGTSNEHRATISCAVPYVVTNISSPKNKIITRWGKFEKLMLLMPYENHNYQNTVFDNCSCGLYFYGDYGPQKPESLNGCVFQGCYMALLDRPESLSCTDWGDFFVINEIKLIGNENGSSQILLHFGSGENGISRYFYMLTRAIAEIREGPYFAPYKVEVYIA